MRKASVGLACLALLAAAVACACASSRAKAGGAEAPTVFAELEDEPRGGVLLELEGSGNGVRRFKLEYPDLGPVAIEGSAEPEGEGWRLEFERLEWFDNWPNGWTEASFLLEGESSIMPDPSGEVWILSLRAAPKLDSVRSAAIRYYDTYVRGPKGLEEFSHRWERIRSACSALLGGFDGPGLARRPDALERYLFPEVYGYDEPPTPGFRKVFGRGREWNADYSAAHFPEGLRKLRDDGTMLRDYEESPGLWQLALSWDEFWEHRGYAAGLKRLPAKR